MRHFLPSLVSGASIVLPLCLNWANFLRFRRTIFAPLGMAFEKVGLQRLAMIETPFWNSLPAGPGTRPDQRQGQRYLRSYSFRAICEVGV